MLHGRGATAQDILSLSGHLNVEGYALLAPQATNHTWYPYSFLAPAEQNEPWLTSAVEVVRSIVADVEAQGITSEHLSPWLLAGRTSHWRLLREMPNAMAVWLPSPAAS